MSDFVCGRFEYVGNPQDLLPAIDQLRSVARAQGFVFKCDVVEELPAIVHEILEAAGEPAQHGVCRFLAGDDDGYANVSEQLLNADDRIVDDKDMSLRAAAEDTVRPLQDFLQAAVRFPWFASPVLVISEGFDDHYPEVEVRPNEIASAIAEEYEKGGRVPSLKLRILSDQR